MIRTKVPDMFNRQERKRQFKEGQQPSHILIACSDARVMFETKFGEAFVIRTAGHVLDNVAIESLKYAVLNTNAKAINIVGHNGCGAVKAYKHQIQDYKFLISGIENNINFSPNILPLNLPFDEFELKNTLGAAIKVAEYVKRLKEGLEVNAWMQDIKTGKNYHLYTFK